MLFCTLSLGFSLSTYAQEDGSETTEETTTTDDDGVAGDSTETETTVVDETEAVVATDDIATDDDEIAGEEQEGEATFHQRVKQLFIDGGWQFMAIVLLCLILGLAIAIERIIALNLSSVNTKKLIAQVEGALNEGGVERAIEVTRATRGPVATIFTQGMMSAKNGITMVEKTVMSIGSIEMGKLERGMVWISLFISLAPMLGFMGTVIGMIDAFESIAAAGDISPSLVAVGIKVALLTTVAGLIVAIILQIFYNYCVSKIDSLVSEMEEASLELVDLLTKHGLSK